MAADTFPPFDAVQVIFQYDHQPKHGVKAEHLDPVPGLQPQLNPFPAPEATADTLYEAQAEQAEEKSSPPAVFHSQMKGETGGGQQAAPEPSPSATTSSAPHPVFRSRHQVLQEAADWKFWE
ncbi:MAG: hypothetical protein ACLTW9_23520 [Enterocloster sp.]